MNVIANVIAVDDSLPMYTVTGIGFTLFIELKKKKERFISFLLFLIAFDFILRSSLSFRVCPCVHPSADKELIFFLRRISFLHPQAAENELTNNRQT